MHTLILVPNPSAITHRSQTSLIALEGPPGATWHPQQERKLWGAEGGWGGGVEVSKPASSMHRTTARRHRSLQLNTYFTLHSIKSLIHHCNRVNWSIHPTHVAGCTSRYSTCRSRASHPSLMLPCIKVKVRYLTDVRCFQTCFYSVDIQNTNIKFAFTWWVFAHVHSTKPAVGSTVGKS